jgi:hypothetical protein
MILLSRTERGRADPKVDADSLGDEARDLCLFPVPRAAVRIAR